MIYQYRTGRMIQTDISFVIAGGEPYIQKAVLSHNGDSMPVPPGQYKHLIDSCHDDMIAAAGLQDLANTQQRINN